MVKFYVFLHGLLYDSDRCWSHDKITKAVGKSVRILSIFSKWRSKDFDNRYHWPHSTKDETIHTWEFIHNSVNCRYKNPKILGYIGFSNGAYFLNTIAQMITLDVPIVSIGGLCYDTYENYTNNNVYLFISPEDEYHYRYAKDCIGHLEKYMNIEVIEYKGGHIIPTKKLRTLFKNYL